MLQVLRRSGATQEPTPCSCQLTQCLQPISVKWSNFWLEQVNVAFVMYSERMNGSVSLKISQPGTLFPPQHPFGKACTQEFS